MKTLETEEATRMVNVKTKFKLSTLRKNLHAI